ncbi:rhomboid-like protein [Mycolicibacterium sp.]|uniref:rhomboid-like protein n=1 Tax=Mycolicibacterium sp. TaxID=2320850 RepID=UPI003D0A94DD
MRSGLARLRVTLGYALIVVTVSVAMLPPGRHDAWIRAASTNLHNLGHGRIGTLFDSAFVVDAGPVYLWLPGLVCLLGIVELQWGGAQLLIAFAIGHLGATLLVAAGLAAAVTWHWTSPAVTHAPDVGMSYGALGVLGALTAAIPMRCRAGWVGWWLAGAAAVAAHDPDFTDIGHVVALTLGVAASLRFGTPAGWTRARLGLLAPAAVFGHLVLADSATTTVTGCAALGAAAFAVVDRRRRRPAHHL